MAARLDMSNDLQAAMAFAEIVKLKAGTQKARIPNVAGQSRKDSAKNNLCDSLRTLCVIFLEFAISKSRPKTPKLKLAGATPLLIPRLLLPLARANPQCSSPPGG